MKTKVREFFIEEYQLVDKSMLRRSLEGEPGDWEALLPDGSGDLVWIVVGNEADVWISEPLPEDGEFWSPHYGNEHHQ